MSQEQALTRFMVTGEPGILRNMRMVKVSRREHRCSFKLRPRIFWVTAFSLLDTSEGTAIEGECLRRGHSVQQFLTTKREATSYCPCELV